MENTFENALAYIAQLKETSPTALQDDKVLASALMSYSAKTKRKYHYIEEITSCVLCGREKRYRQRVYEKPEPHLRVNWKEDACSTHFI